MYHGPYKEEATLRHVRTCYVLALSPKSYIPIHNWIYTYTCTVHVCVCMYAVHIAYIFSKAEIVSYMRVHICIYLSLLFVHVCLFVHICGLFTYVYVCTYIYIHIDAYAEQSYLYQYFSLSLYIIYIYMSLYTGLTHGFLLNRVLHAGAAHQTAIPGSHGRRPGICA